MEDNEQRLLDELFGISNEPLKTYYEYNRSDPYYVFLDEKENSIDAIETALKMFERVDNLKWKWITIALHQALYGFCVSALHSGNFEIVLRTGWDDDNNTCVQISNDLPMKSKVVHYYINNIRTPAYRIEWSKIDSFPEIEGQRDTKKKRNLISFWTALARIQDPYYWMKRTVVSKSVNLSDEQLDRIVWLTTMVRNDIMHFAPKGYSIGILSIVKASLVFLDVIEFLVFESYSILFTEADSKERIQNALSGLKKRLLQEELKLTSGNTQS